MPHLSPDRLAALVDEGATADEQAHLSGCAACAGELAALRRLAAMTVAERERVGPPLTTWESLSEQLRRGGMFADQTMPLPVVVRATPASSPVPAWRSWAMRAAAAIALLVGGVVGGRVSAGASLVPGGLRGEIALGALTIRLDSTTTPIAAVESFASRDEAAEALQRAERTYRLAAAYLAQFDSTGRGDGGGAAVEQQMQTRLAALEEMVATSRAALYAAPQDPVINQYYLATLGAREAVLRQLGGTAPVSVRVAY
jgi:hypothetical protein